MKDEKYVEDLRKAAEEFNAGLEHAAEAYGKLQAVIRTLPMDEKLRDGYITALGYDTAIAISIYTMMAIAKEFPAKYAAMLIMIEMSRAFKHMLSLNVMANQGILAGHCPVHGPACSTKGQDEFPQHVDEDLRPISEVPQ